jgi:4-amino-4-deoxychorismate lyase
MCQLLETIKCADGRLENLEFHQARFSHARKLKFDAGDEISLEQQIHVPDFAKTGLFRCRVIYGQQIEKIEFIPHVYRVINSLQLVVDNTIDYKFKFADRKNLEQLFEKRGNCDDIIIVKNGLITDSFSANLVFFDGKKWWTPDTPLLPGTQRAQLLKAGIIKASRITANDLLHFQKAGLINAMNTLENMPQISIGKIQS